MGSYKLLNCNHFTIVWCKRKTKVWYIYFFFYCTPIFNKPSGFFFEGLTVNGFLANLWDDFLDALKAVLNQQYLRPQ
jgi:hypothetical protein